MADEPEDQDDDEPLMTTPEIMASINEKRTRYLAESFDLACERGHIPNYERMVAVALVLSRLFAEAAEEGCGQWAQERMTEIISFVYPRVQARVREAVREEQGLPPHDA